MFGIGVRTDARGVGAFTALAVAPVAPVLLLSQGTLGPARVLRSSELVAYALILGAAVCVYFHWRLTSSTADRGDTTRLAGWLTVGLVVVGLHGLVQASLIEGTAADERDRWPLVGHIVVLVLLMVVAHVAERAEVPADPMVVGTIVGLTLVGLVGVILRFASPLVVSPTADRLLSTLAMVTGLLLAATTMHRAQVRPWIRHRLALAAILLTAAHCVGSLEVRNEVVVTVAVVANLQAAVVLCTMTQRLLRRSVLEHQRELLKLHEILARARADVLEERELLHEVGSTVAGITSASRFMRQESLLSPQRRARLEHMVAEELARLDRLMSSRAPSPTREFEVGAVVERLATSHQARGLDVRWTAAHVQGVGDPDDLAEVVNVLLENARRHGGRRVHLDVTEVADQVQVTCSDDGPGVSEEVRARLFTSGARGPASPGQGLGLAIARRLMTERGGSLELSASSTTGATFVARLPKREMADAASHHVA